MKLGRGFFERDIEVVAQDLLGKVIEKNGRELVITETEAYLGPEDNASHARFGKTKRSKIMWLKGGHLYVYLIYGMHEMVNIVAGKQGNPGAVLIRAGYDYESGEVYDGPGKLSKYLNINREVNGVDLVKSSRVKILDKGIDVRSIKKSKRIGVEYAGEWKDRKLRYVAEI